MTRLQVALDFLTVDEAVALVVAHARRRGVELDARQSPRTWVELMLALHGRDPLRCPHCDTQLLVLPLSTSMPTRVEGIDSS